MMVFLITFFSINTLIFFFPVLYIGLNFIQFELYIYAFE